MKAIHLQQTAELTLCGLKVKGKRQVVSERSSATCHRCLDKAAEKTVSKDKAEVKPPEEKKIIIPKISKQSLPANLEVEEEEQRNEQGSAPVLPAENQKEQIPSS